MIPHLHPHAGDCEHACCLKIEHLSVHIGGETILDNIDLHMHCGQMVALIGPNGSGKTTTINILNGYLEPVAGECLIFGENIRTMRPQTRARIALLLEGHVQYAFMTIREIERFYSQYYPRWDARAYYGLMELLAVAPGQRIARMSCGQRSQVALGLILAQNADLMILDDLGTEMITAYSTSALYTLINTRLTRAKATIISTNCSNEELQKKYTPQILSRIAGEYQTLPFVGRDIRQIKKEREA